MATAVATSMVAAAPLPAKISRQVPIFDSLASSSAPARPSPSSVQVWRNPRLRSSGNVHYGPTGREYLAGIEEAAKAHQFLKSRFFGRERICKNFGGFGLPVRAGEGNGVAAEVSLEGLFQATDEAVDINEEVGIDAESLQEGQRVVYLNLWQMKRMIAPSNLGARCVNVEVLAVEVGLKSPDVFAWLENIPSKTILLTTSEVSYMEDVHIVEEAEKRAIYVPPPPIPSRDVNMRNKVENLVYTMKEIMSGT